MLKKILKRLCEINKNINSNLLMKNDHNFNLYPDSRHLFSLTFKWIVATGGSIFTDQCLYLLGFILNSIKKFLLKKILKLYSKKFFDSYISQYYHKKQILNESN